MGLFLPAGLDGLEELLLALLELADCLVGLCCVGLHLQQLFHCRHTTAALQAFGGVQLYVHTWRLCVLDVLGIC